MVLTANGKRAGRPPNPPAPKVPEMHDRPEYEGRLRKITDALEIGDLAEDVRLYLQMLLRRCDVMRATDAKRFPAKGEEQVTLLLRVVFETTNGAAALTLPILKAVAISLHPVWVAKGLALLEAFDCVDLVGLHATLTDLGLVEHLDRVIFKKLKDILGPPVLPAVPKPKPAPKLPKKAPAGMSQESWDAVLGMRAAGRKRTEKRRKARMAA